MLSIPSPVCTDVEAGEEGRDVEGQVEVCHDEGGHDDAQQMDAEARDSSTNPKEFQVFLLSCLVEDCNDEVLEVLDVAKSPQEDVETLSESHEMVTAPSFLTMLWRT